MNTSTDKPSLTQSDIINAAKRYNESNGALPNAKSGDATVYYGAGVTWDSIDRALRDGKQGLPGGSSLKDLLATPTT